MSTRPELLLGDGRFFEGPRWRSGSWWASDMFDARVVEVRDGVEHRSVDIEGQPSGLGWLPGGDLLVVSMQQQMILAVDATGHPRVHADLAGHMVGPANDLLVADDGWAWVGGLGFDLNAGDAPQASPLLRVSPEGVVTIAASDLMSPNGMALDTVRGELLVAETFAARVTAFSVGEDGSLTGRRARVQLAAEPTGVTMRQLGSRLLVAPDGIALDAAGSVWVADGTGGRCVLVDRAGRVIDAVLPPRGLAVFACALGGPDGTTLLLCCAPDAVQARREEARDASLWTVEVATPSIARPARP